MSTMPCNHLDIRTNGTSIGRYYFGYWMRRRTRIETSIFFGRKKENCTVQIIQETSVQCTIERKCYRCGKWQIQAFFLLSSSPSSRVFNSPLLLLQFFPFNLYPISFSLHCYLPQYLLKHSICQT